MSVEVEHQIYLHRPLAPCAVPSLTFIDIAEEVDAESENSTTNDSENSTASDSENSTANDAPSVDTKTLPNQIVPFNYNHLHDLESVHWLAHYMLFAGEVIDAGTEEPVTDAHRAAHHKLAKSLFGDLAFRTNIVISGILDQELATLRVHPRVAEIATLIDGMRNCVTAAFRNAEAQLPIPFPTGHETHTGMLGEINNIQEVLEGQDISIRFDDGSSKMLRDALAA